jgi:hypothetical protein
MIENIISINIIKFAFYLKFSYCLLKNEPTIKSVKEKKFIF